MSKTRSGGAKPRGGKRYYQKLRQRAQSFAINTADGNWFDLEAGATVSVGSWPPALGIFETLLRRGKLDESRKMSDGSLLEFISYVA